jgi:hypothetical protein
VKLDTETFANAVIDLLDALHDVQGGAHRAHGVILVRHGVAKVRHHPVTQELRDVSLVAAHHVTAQAVIADEQGVPIFWIKPLG